MSGTLASSRGLDADALLDGLGRLLDYPTEEWWPVLHDVEAYAAADGTDDAVRAPLRAFREAVEPLSATDREELHTRTFDIAATCPPYVGVVLFGENGFKRGGFLGELSGRMAELEFDPGPELPDHLSVLLRFAAILPDDERTELTKYCLLAPVRALARRLDVGNPYGLVLGAIEAALTVLMPGVEAAPMPVEVDRPLASGCSAIGLCGGGATGSQSLDARE